VEPSAPQTAPWQTLLTAASHRPLHRGLRLPRREARHRARWRSARRPQGTGRRSYAMARRPRLPRPTLLEQRRAHPDRRRRSGHRRGDKRGRGRPPPQPSPRKRGKRGEGGRLARPRSGRARPKAAVVPKAPQFRGTGYERHDVHPRLVARPHPILGRATSRFELWAGSTSARRPTIASGSARPASSALPPASSWLQRSRAAPWASR
jgi:hypothetical protein